MNPITIYRYGAPRSENEGLRIGVARQAPRGIRREDWKRLNYFDTRAQALAPSRGLIAEYQSGKISFAAFSRRYRSEMKEPAARQAIEFLASMALYQPISLGCFCEEPSHCHRSILQRLLTKEAKAKGALFASLKSDPRYCDSREFTSPVCYADFEHEE